MLKPPLRISRLSDFKTSDQKYYIRFLVTANFYFDKVDVLEIVLEKSAIMPRTQTV